MKRWLGSLLIAAVSSVVTLLLAWSALGPRNPAAQSPQDGNQSAAAVKVATADSSDEVLKQLAALDVPEQADHGDQADRPHGPPADAGDRAHFGDRQRERSSAAIGENADGVTPGMRMRQEFLERCTEVARDIDPEWGKRIEAARQKDPLEFERSMRQSGRKLYALAELKQRDPDLYGAKLNELRMEMQVRQRARELCQARASGNRAEAQTQEAVLRNMLTLQLAASLKARGDLTCKLQEQINNIKDEMTQQAGHFNEIVESRFQTLITQCQSEKDSDKAAGEAVSLSPPAPSPN